MDHVRKLVGGSLTVVAFTLRVLAASLWFATFVLLAFASPVGALLLRSATRRRVSR